MERLKTAVIGYDPKSKQWLAASLKDAEGVYIDPVRVSPAVGKLLADIGQGINYITLDTFKALRDEAGKKKRRA